MEELNINGKGTKSPGLAPEPANSGETRESVQRVIVSQEKTGSIFVSHFKKDREKKNREWDEEENTSHANLGSVPGWGVSLLCP